MGTNSFHMIVCQASEDRDHFEVITRVREAVPFFRRALGAHTIDASAMNAAMSILKDMKDKASEKGARRLVAVATSAVRESDNGEAVLRRIREEVGLDARMISGREEARLIYLGVLWSMPQLKNRFAIVDIGGGSMELIVADSHRTYFSESYKLGAARLTQRFFKKESPTPQEIRELHDEVRGMLRPAAARLSETGGFQRLIGTSGTVQALAKLDRARSKKQARSESHGYAMKLDRIEEIVAFLEEASLEGERIKGISSDRNRTILAGSIVLLETMRSLNVNEITVCDSALREGVVVDMLLQEGWLDAGLKEHLNPRARSIYSLLEKYNSSVEHAEQVAALAFQLFDQTRLLKLHYHNQDTLHLLWSASMLHDVGMFIGRNGHHKHSYYLIKNGGLLGHSEEEVALIANIARYHRGSEPKLSHDSYVLLSDSEKQIVSDMAAILRLAEALDRSHRQIVKRVELDLQGSGKGQERTQASLLIFVRPGESWEPETWALKEKKAFFEKQFQLKLNFEVRVETRPQISRGSYLPD
jgi:exopolyphosphatase/guanosine-5'-triphosphate,3'-diphosphate pyrophosphatase